VTENWDYRYSLFVRRRFLWMHYAPSGWDEARLFALALRAFAKSGSPRVCVLTVEGTARAGVDRSESGRVSGSGPVRWGNAAADQIQHEVYGEIVYCASQWARLQGDITP
jgi:hypothetical protein